MSDRNLRILVVDDERIVRESLAGWFAEEGHRVDAAASAAEALRLLEKGKWDVALLDIKMPGMDGLELQQRLREADPDLTLIIMTAYASVDTAVRALKEGAYDYITKPFDPDDLARLVAKAAEHRALKRENIQLRRNIEEIARGDIIVGEDPAMLRVLEMIRTVAATDTTVLIRGESGTGKELVARALHAASPRRFMPIVPVNCGALTETLLESELFGHEKGAFTGARYRRKGKLEMADGGTLFLDEVGDISAKTQIDLLRVLEEKHFCRVGGNRPVTVDLRLVSATNRDLEAMVEDGAFRRDLYYRLNVFEIRVPPLRERPGDIPLLAEHFLRTFGARMNRRMEGFTPEAMELLRAHEWPGNVRELENAVERAMVVGEPPLIRAGDLPLAAGNGPVSARIRTLADAERAHIERILAETDWNITRAAALLEIDRTTLYAKIRKFELARPAPS